MHMCTSVRENLHAEDDVVMNMNTGKVGLWLLSGPWEKWVRRCSYECIVFADTFDRVLINLFLFLFMKWFIAGHSTPDTRVNYYY